MAVGGGKEALTLDKIVECDVCMEIMTQPQALRCLHHFCKTCVEELFKRTDGSRLSRILCPVCRTCTFRKDIKDSFMMNNLLEVYHKGQTSIGSNTKEQLCTLCDRPNVTSMCSNCKIKLCKECKNRHLRIPSCRNHNVIGVDEIEEVHVMNIIQFCKFHPTCEIKYNCIPCRMTVCSECKIENHDEHKTQTVEEAFRNLSLLTKEHMNTISGYKEHVHNRLAHIENMKSKCKPNYDRIKEKIISQREALISRLKRDSDTLLQKVHHQNEAELKQLDKIKACLENQLTTYESLQSWTSTILNMTEGPGALYELQGGLYKRIESCAKIPPCNKDLKDYDTKYAEFAAHTDIHTITDNIVGEVIFVSENVGRKVAAKPKSFVKIANNKLLENFANNLSENRQINLFIRTMSRRTLTLFVRSNETVENIKWQLCPKVSVPVEDQKLRHLFRGNELMNERTLDDYGIQENSTLELITRVSFQQVRHSRYSPIYIEPTFDKEDLKEPLRDDDPRRYQPIKAAKNEDSCSFNYDPLVQKFIRHILKKGNKETSTTIITKAFENIKYIQLERYHKAETDEEREAIELNPLTIFHQAVNNCKPLLIARDTRRGGVKYKVPIPVGPNYQTFTAFKWLIESASDKDPNKRIWIALAYELISASKLEGKSVRKKQELHRICEENKAYAHFR